jgi:hypothetical protein
VAYTRVPIALDQPLEPGDYESTLSITGNQRSLTKSDLQTALASRFGNRVQVLDWTTSGTNYVLQFRVLPANQAANNSDIVQAAFWVPIVITVLAITGAIYAAYRLTVEVKSAAQLIPAPARGAAVAGAGVGLAGLGVGAALFGLWLLGRR